MNPSLDPIFKPRSVAIIGASRRKHTIGWDILHNLVGYEFQGQVFAVNPAAPVIHSQKAYRDVLAIPDPVDLAIIVVPKQCVADVVDQCGQKGVKGLVIITAGFKETGETGARLEAEVIARARQYGMRVIGPNCMGVINTDPAVRLQGSFSASEPLDGNIAFSSQSGALGEAILASMRDLGLGLSMFASLGNKADVSGNDLLEYWEDDPRTRVIVMYLESFGNPRRFVQIARRVTTKKPILAVKSGRTAAGARAAASHTGSLAGADTAVESLLSQCGVIRAATIEELFVYASAFAAQPVPNGNRVAIVTNSGGPAILATDACVQAGMELPSLTPETQAAMRAVLAAEASVANPVDMIATATGATYEVCLRAAANDPNVDALVAIFTSLEMIDSVDVARGILRGVEGCTKPVLVCFMGRQGSVQAIDLMKGAGLPVYRFPEEVAQALSALIRYRHWLARPVGRVVAFENFDSDAIARVFSAVRAEGRAQLTLAEAQRVIGATGVRVAPWREARDEASAVRAAEELGYPVVVKLSSAALLHKSEAGGVRLNLRDAGDVRAAAHAMLDRFRATDPDCSLVVQRMAVSGTEVIIGAATDPKFGPLLMFGLGGIFVEILKDVAFRVHPISDVDADEMIHAIKGFPLLTGARGHEPVDLDGLRETLLRLNQLLTEFPGIQEFDINPLFAGASHDTTVAADARMRIAPASPEPPATRPRVETRTADLATTTS